MNESCNIQMSHVTWLIHDSLIWNITLSLKRESVPSWQTTHSYETWRIVSHVTWLIHDSLIYDITYCELCHVTHSRLNDDLPIWDMTHSRPTHMRHDSFTTHHMRHDSVMRHNSPHRLLKWEWWLRISVWLAKVMGPILLSCKCVIACSSHFRSSHSRIVCVCLCVCLRVSVCSFGRQESWAPSFCHANM